MKTDRRALLSGFCALALIGQPAIASSLVARTGKGPPAGGGGSNTLTISSPSPAASRTPYTDKPPAAGTEATIVLLPDVAQDDEAVDIAALCYEPGSPSCTSMTLTGSSCSYLKVLSNNKIAIRDAARATIPRNTYLIVTGVMTNANGDSDPFTVNFWIPPANSCVFFARTGNDTTGDGSLGNPYKNLPRTQQWTGTGGAGGGPQFTNKYLVFKGGEKYYGEVGTYNSGILFAPDHPGCQFVWHGWQGQCKLSGDADEAGAHTTASSGETYAAAATGTLEKVTLGTALKRHQNLHYGNTMYRYSQFPMPNDLWKALDPQAAANGEANYNSTTQTSDGGFMPMFATTNSGDSTAKRIYYAPGGTNSYWQNSDLDARFNNQSVARDVNGIGVWLLVWVGGNFVNLVNVLEYDVTLHRAYFNAGSGGLQAPNGVIGSNLTSGTNAIALVNSPYDVRVAGQFSILPGSSGLTAIVYRGASPGQLSATRLHKALGWGDVSGHVHYGLWIQRYAGVGASTDAGGTAITARNNDASGTAWATGLRIYGARIQQMNNEDEDGLAFEVSGTTGLKDFIIDRVHLLDNYRGRGCRATGPMLGKTSGSGPGGWPTMQEVIDYPYGKMRWWMCDQAGVSLTLDLQQKMRGVHQLGWMGRDFKGAHADGHAISVFLSSGLYYDHNVIQGEWVDLGLRWYSSDINDVFLPASTLWVNWYLQNIYLGEVQSTNVGIMLQTGSPGGRFYSCIFITSSRSADVSGLPCLYIGGGWDAQFYGCILNGVGVNNTAHGTTQATYGFDGCGWTGTPLTDDAANSRRNTNSTTLSALTKWDGVTIPTAWKSLLRAPLSAAPGTLKMGRFHYV